MAHPFMNDYPTRRIKPVNGMAINEGVWQEAHDFHRVRDRWHMLHAGHGILHGLSVVQNKPLDTAVWILPGFAVDAQGRSIVIKEPHLCDIGSTRGTVYVYLTASEHEIQLGGEPADDDQPVATFMQEDVNIVASALLPESSEPYVELARIQRSDLVAVRDAVDVRRPGVNEIDLRYRREVLPRVLPVLNAGIVHLGGHDPCAWEGLDALSQSAAFAQQCRLCISDDVPANDESRGFHLLYVRAQSAFDTSPAMVESLAAFAQRGVLFVEVNSQSPTAAGARDAVGALFDSMGITLVPLSPAHPLQTSPHRFAQWPEGGASGDMRMAAEQRMAAILSGLDLATTWQGIALGKPASREVIRAAHEWGLNLLQFALEKADQPAREAQA